MKNKQQLFNDVNRVFDTPFIIQEKTVMQDENGIETETWKDKYKLFAAAKSLFGSEYELARQRTDKKTVKFIVRAGVHITGDMQIIFDGNAYDIENVDNIGFKNELLEIKATLRGVR